ncbi:MAG: DMT family transporter [Betaproteobacteria bacterium]|nr:DMT family transporter [Betaproteobacteria bacterium]
MDPARPASQLALGLLLAGAGAIAFSGKAIIVKLGYRYGVDAVTLIMYRMLFAMPFFLLMAWWAGRGQERLDARQWRGIVFLGVTGYYLASFLDFLGLQYISASLERLILYLNPTLVLLISLALYRKPVAGRQLLGLLISYTGIVVVFGQELRLQGPEVALGSGLVFASALSYALYLVYSGEVVKRLGSLRLVGLASTVACLCCIVQFWALRPLSAADVPAQVLWLSVLNALACTVAPVLMVMMAIERIGAALSAQVGMIGPMVTLALGAWFLGEAITTGVLLGTVLVLAGVYVVTRQRDRPADRQAVATQDS